MINRKAYFEYSILKEYTAGIVLQGSEVKALRNHEISFNDSYVFIQDNEVFIKNLYINKFTQSSINNHIETRDRKLLLKRKEIGILQEQIKTKGITVVPLEIFLSNGKFKVKLAIAKGKKLYDKKESIREKDIKIQTEKELKQK
jgi:SsrA-binding protein